MGKPAEGTEPTCERVPPGQTSFEGGGAGLKATLDVEYATPDPSLHTELFVKLPHESDQGHKYLIDAYLNQNQPETSFARLVAHKCVALPVIQRTFVWPTTARAHWRETAARW